MLDPGGSAHMCTTCALLAMGEGAEFGHFDVMLVLAVPAVEAVTW